MAAAQKDLQHHSQGPQQQQQKPPPAASHSQTSSSRRPDPCITATAVQQAIYLCSFSGQSPLAAITAL